MSSEEQKQKAKELEMIKSELSEKSTVYVCQPNSNIFFKVEPSKQLQKVNAELYEINNKNKKLS